MIDQDAAVASVEKMSARLADAKGEIAKRIVGQTHVVDLTLAAILSGGHALLMGAPGLGKTRLVDTIAAVMGLAHTRVQFTPDLMPADILGSEVMDTDAEGRRSFRFIKGPVFTRLLMADEINRASPRTQSALLQAMQEHSVTINGVAHDLPAPFHVLATQNPMDHEGTYPLPEAQLDRFLMRIDLPYPTREEERAIVMMTTGSGSAPLAPVFDIDGVIAAQTALREMPFGADTLDLVLDLVRACRPDAPDAPWADHIQWGPGPRAAQSLVMAARAHAVITGRLIAERSDIAAVMRPVLCHRIGLGFAAQAAGYRVDDILDQVAERFDLGA